MMRCTGSFLPRMAAIAAVLAPLTAAAGTDTDVLSVSATVQTSCQLNGGTLSFGDYSSGQEADLDVQGTISYAHCSGNLTFELDGGGSADVNARRMTSGTNKLNYQIYRTAARNAVWGSGLNSHGLVLIGTQSGSVPVYGRIPARQTVPAGTYTDTVNITLTF